MPAGRVTIDRSERMLLATIFFVGLLPLSSVSPQVAPTAPAVSAELRIRLQSSGGIPVAGALVALLNARDSVVAEGLSTESGTRLLRAPPGTYRVRARRIGFLPFTSSPVVVPRQGELLLTVETSRVVLNRIVVTAKSQCKRSDPGSQSLGIVWDEIDKALRASQLTMEDLSGFGRGRVYRKEVGTDGTVLSSDTTLFAITDRRPFGAIDPDTLAMKGYVLGDETHGWNYFGPDETVLLSEQFAATHCFRLVRETARRGEIGVAFEPVPRRAVADIAGVLWVDERTAELREVVFHYVNAGALSRFEAGGFTRFLRVPSGAWLVDEWRLKVPRLAMRRSPSAWPRYTVIGYSEHGGGILIGGRVGAGSGRTGTVTGVVYDSISERPLAGASVSLDGTMARSDQLGRFTFTNVPTGNRLLTFTDPMLSALGFIALEREIEVRDDTLAVQLATPSLKTTWLRVCGDSAPSGAGSERGVLHGFVRDESGQPVTGAVVRMFWTEQFVQAGLGTTTPQLELKTETDNSGHYAACGFRQPAQGKLSATANKLASPQREFSFGSSLVTRRDLALAPAVALQTIHNRRELTVTVVDSFGWRPLADATISIEGTTDVSRTDDAGIAVIHPSHNEFTLVARRLGFSGQSFAVKLGNARRQRLRVELAPVHTLATVKVVGTADLPAALEKRRMWGRGTFYGPEEIAKAHNARMLLAKAPGALVEGTGTWALRFRHPNLGGDCWADLYIDGKLSAPGIASFGPFAAGRQKIEELDSYSPDALYAIEVYPRASEAPLSVVRLRDGCGAVLIWTRAHIEQQLESEQHRQTRGAADSLSTKR